MGVVVGSPALRSHRHYLTAFQPDFLPIFEHCFIFSYAISS